MPLIYFVRHGQTDWNAEGRLQGEIDVRLNARGRDQALRNGGVLREVIEDYRRFEFVASPLRRTRETMEIILRAMGLPPEAYRTDATIREILFGDWGGMTMAEIAERDPVNYAARKADIWNVAPPKGEAFRDFHARIAAWFDAIDRDMIVVSHGGVSRCIRGHVLKLPPEEIARLDVPQDKVLMIAGEKITWL